VSEQFDTGTPVRIVAGPYMGRTGITLTSTDVDGEDGWVVELEDGDDDGDVVAVRADALERLM
jgi:hypothetical protein